ncbi:hypothetical protein CQA01_17830 [Cyclobacterium qasimii]|uniref:Uncharacterized protein n=2 Tax=Cyclobacterium qasimii TaxID=1350429 RepID=A0A512CAL5_9BACT|nr:hypothetical protein CQA01_17830 [Cyclobacterium qasimii]
MESNYKAKPTEAVNKTMEIPSKVMLLHSSPSQPASKGLELTTSKLKKAFLNQTQVTTNAFSHGNNLSLV